MYCHRDLMEDHRFKHPDPTLIDRYNDIIVYIFFLSKDQVYIIFNQCLTLENNSGGKNLFIFLPTFQTWVKMSVCFKCLQSTCFLYHYYLISFYFTLTRRLWLINNNKQIYTHSNTYFKTN